MKIELFTSILAFLVAPQLALCCGENNHSKDHGSVPAPEVPSECCCMTYKPACTMNMERMYHMKIFYNRKEGLTADEFNSYWANNHTSVVEPFHLRLGIVKYSQYHSTPDFRDLARVEGGLPILEFDGAAEFWAPSLDTFMAMQSDPYYLEKIVPDEANFIDHKSVKLTLGVDYTVIEHQNKVEEHGRTFQ
jgi:hypothetical protein